MPSMVTSVPAAVPEDCRRRAVVMQLTCMPESSATVFVTTSLTEAASSESELYVQVVLKGKRFCSCFLCTSPTVMVVQSVKGFTVVTASVVAETIVTATVVTTVDVATSAVTAEEAKKSTAMGRRLLVPGAFPMLGAFGSWNLPVPFSFSPWPRVSTPLVQRPSAFHLTTSVARCVPDLARKFLLELLPRLPFEPLLSFEEPPRFLLRPLETLFFFGACFPVLSTAPQLLETCSREPGASGPRLCPWP